jgi:hypothetical protein
MKVEGKRGYAAFMCGFGLSLLPELLSHILSTSTVKHVDLLFQWMGIILLPGLVVAYPLSEGIHDPNLFVATIVSGLFYSILFYLLLSLVARFRRAVSQPDTSAS